jgi:hypothetical protein
MENTKVIAFTIGPGFVPTHTAASSIPKLAAMMGKSEQEMQDILKEHTISTEAAGAGFAAAVVLAGRYGGQEISSMQALVDAGIAIPEPSARLGVERSLAPEQCERVLILCRSVHGTLAEQSAGWKDRSVFEQQWLIRTFRKKASLPVEEWLKVLARLEEALAAQDAASMAAINTPFDRLAAYYAHLYEMAKGYVKDPAQREEQLRIVGGWRAEVEGLGALLG